MLTGTIFDIKRFAVHDGPGVRTTVFLKGCPLKCPWCHNPEGMDPRVESCQTKRVLDGKEFRQKSEIGRRVLVSELINELEDDRLIMEESGGGITFSGGEPLMQHQFLRSMLEACKEKELHTAVDTSGFAKETAIKEIIPLTRLFLFDLKSLDPEVHAEITGAPLDVILSSFKSIADSGVNIRLRIPVVPGFNHSAKDLELYLDFISKYKDRLDGVHLLPFHSVAGNKFKKLERVSPYGDQPSLPESDLKEWMTEIEKTGVPVKTGG